MFKSAKGRGAPSGKGAAGLSFIGPEVVISGDFVTSAGLHLDGRIQGDVRCASLCQGEKGAISGDIVAEEVRIAGEVRGLVNAATVIIEATARLSGDVAYDSLSIAPGARIDGRVARRAALEPGSEPDPAVLIATPTENESPTGEGLLPLVERRGRAHG